jgi:hypothetical protein
MERQAQIYEALTEQYGLLLVGLLKRDDGWHSFKVVWSDDGGVTRLAAEMTLHDMMIALDGSTKEHVAYLLRECRREAKRVNRLARRRPGSRQVSGADVRAC